MSETDPFLLKLRQRTDLKLKPLDHLLSSFVGYDEQEHPLRVRYYQIQGALHLVASSSFVLGDQCGLGKTLQAIVALCCLLEKNPRTKAVVITTKSSVPEWADEFAKFTKGIEVVQVPDFSALPPLKKSPLSAKDRARFRKLFGSTYFEAMKVESSKRQEVGGSHTNPTPIQPDVLSLVCGEESDEEKKKRIDLAERKAKREELKRKEYLDDICRLWLISQETNDKALQGLVNLVGVSLAQKTPVNAEVSQKLSVELQKHRLRAVPSAVRRQRFYEEEFIRPDGPRVMVVNYRKAVIDFQGISPAVEGSVLILDECTAVKSTRSEVHKCCRHLAEKASRVWGMTATLIQNRLLEGFGIFRVIRPGVFRTLQGFMDEFCVVQMQRVSRNRRIPIVVGHTKAQIERFRAAIDPYFLGRAKHEVASELPSVVTKVVKVGLSSLQRNLYDQALSDLLEVIDRGGEIDLKALDQLTRVTYCQEIVDHPLLIGHDGPSEKLDRLIDMVSEGDFAEEKVVVFSRFKKMINIIERHLDQRKIKSVRITGDEGEKQRISAMREFRKPDSSVRVALITTAGSMAINLQAAAVLIFYDTPWSAGDWIQTFGRIDRIGSTHDVIYCLHLAASDTIDERVLTRVREKRRLIEAALGTQMLRDKDADYMVSVEDDISELFNDLARDARTRSQA